jgi:FkbM family methyltransferase
VTSPVLRLASFAARILPTPARRALYRLGPLTTLTRRLLNQAAPAGPTEIAVAGGDLAGTRLILDLKTEKDLWLGTYEPDLQAALRLACREGMTVYDVGANIGYVALLAARAIGPSGRVVAFEPLPANLKRLQAHLALNGPGARITVVPLAVAEGVGMKRFLIHPSGAMGKVKGAAGRAEAYSAEIEVETIDLDTFTFGRGNPPPDLVKMDIEGGEVLALPGMRRVLAEIRPTLLIELHGPQAAQVAWDTLTQTGYSLHQMRPGFPLIRRVEDLAWKAYVVGLPPTSKGLP